MNIFEQVLSPVCQFQVQNVVTAERQWQGEDRSLDSEEMHIRKKGANTQVPVEVAGAESSCWSVGSRMESWTGEVTNHQDRVNW